MKLKKINIISNKGNIIKDLFEIQPEIYKDNRGYFFESYNKIDFTKIGIKTKFPQVNISYSEKNVLRGMHFQKKHPQAKLIQCISGSIIDCVVDLRAGSETFGEYAMINLNNEKNNLMYIPEGFAHGYYVLSDHSVISYHCSDFYYANDEGGILWNDPYLNIQWPLETEYPIISKKDSTYKAIENLNSYEFKRYGIFGKLRQIEKTN